MPRLFSGVITKAARLVHMPRSITDHNHIVNLCVRHYTSRMLKKSASFVLASFRSSTYPRGYASGLHSLRPRWTAFLSILRTILVLSLFRKSHSEF